MNEHDFKEIVRNMCRRFEKAPECLCGRCRVDPTSCPYCNNCLSRKPDHREGL